MNTSLLKTAGLIAATFITISVHSQGTVDFDTYSLEPSARVYHYPYSDQPLEGTNFFAQLYALAGTGQSTFSLLPVGTPVNFGFGSHAGYVQTSGMNSLGMTVNSAVVIPTPSPGGPVTIQLRAWWGGGTVITNFEGTVTSGNPKAWLTWSPVLNLSFTGTPPGVPVDLTGLFGPVPVPEPSIVWLSGLGTVALLFFRRR